MTQRANRYRALTDSALQHVLEVLEREVEVLADAVWPQAWAKKVELEQSIAEINREIERRRC